MINHRFHDTPACTPVTVLSSPQNLNSYTLLKARPDGGAA